MKIINFYHTDKLLIFGADTSTELALQFVETGISAGFPSPAEDFLELTIDLNKELVKHPSTTFYGKVKGESMQDAGFSDGDILIIDKSLQPTDGKIAVCFIDGEFTVKRIKTGKDCIWLIAENKKYNPIKVTKDNDFIVWGIVTNIIKKVY